MRARALALAAGGALALAGCALQEPFARTNPFDPDADITLSLGGPDSVHAIGESFTTPLLSTAPLPPGPLGVTWRSSAPAIVYVAGGGEYRVASASAQYVAVTLEATFLEEPIDVGGTPVSEPKQRARRTVWVGQRVAQLALACADAGAPAACDATPLAIGAARPVQATLRDARGNAVRSQQAAFARGTATSRDPLVASVAVAAPAAGTLAVQGIGAGSTWIVLAIDGARDSVRVVVGP